MLISLKLKDGARVYLLTRRHIQNEYVIDSVFHNSAMTLFNKQNQFTIHHLVVNILSLDSDIE